MADIDFSTINTLYIQEPDTFPIEKKKLYIDGTIRWAKMTLYFDENGGGSVSNKTVYYKRTYGTLPTTSKTGYTFDGWFTAENWSTEVTASTVVNETDDHTLYAKHNINSYTITWKSYAGTTLKTDVVNYGGTSNAPLGTSDNAQYDYSWPVSSVTVTGNQTITETRVTRSYLITWKSYAGTTLKSETLNYGATSTAPTGTADTAQYDYSWPKASTTVTGTETITETRALQTYTVIFEDVDGTVLKTQTVNYGGNATPPLAPSRTGYTFDGWYGTYTNVTSNRTIYAEYTINTYTVTFYDWDDDVLKTQTVNYGANATPPSNPTRSSYTFDGWDGTYTNVTSNRNITATYKEAPVALTYYQYMDRTQTSLTYYVENPNPYPVRIYYGTSSNPNSSYVSVSANSDEYVQLTGLSPDTTYTCYFRCYSTVSGIYSSQVSRTNSTEYTPLVVRLGAYEGHSSNFDSNWHTFDFSNMPGTSYNGKSMRVVLVYRTATSGTTYRGDTQIDQIRIGGTTFDMSVDEDWRKETSITSNNTIGNYSSRLGTTTSIGTSVANGYWSRDPNATGSGGTGSALPTTGGPYAIYTESSGTSLGDYFWAMSPTFTYSASSIADIKLAMEGNACGILAVYLISDNVTDFTPSLANPTEVFQVPVKTWVYFTYSTSDPGLTPSLLNYNANPSNVVALLESIYPAANYPVGQYGQVDNDDGIWMVCEVQLI